MLRPCKSDPVFWSDNYRSYFVRHLNILIKILVYSKIINKIFNFTSNFKVGLNHEKFEFVHASCTLIIFFQHFSVLFTREKNVKQRKNYSDYLTAYFYHVLSCCTVLRIGYDVIIQNILECSRLLKHMFALVFSFIN